MFHVMHLGFFDRAALKENRRVVVKPLDLEYAGRLFQELGGTITFTTATLDGQRFGVENDGSLCCPFPERGTRAVDFIYHLANQTGCDIAIMGTGGAENADQFYQYHKNDFHYPIGARGNVGSPASVAATTSAKLAHPNTHAS